MTKAEATEIIDAVRAAESELEAQLDIRDWPDELCEALDRATAIAKRYL